MENKIIKADINPFITYLSQISKLAVDGELSPLEVFVRFKELSEHLEILKNKIKKIAIAEAIEYKGQQYLGYFPVVTNKPTYDYSHIPEYNELKERIKDIEDKAKVICKVNNGQDLYDVETGEMKYSAKVKSNSEVLNLNKK